MGNSQKKTPAHGEGGGPHSQSGTPGRRRSQGNNTANSKTQEVQGKKPAANGTLPSGRSENEPQGCSPAVSSSGEQGCNLDALCGALPPPLSRLKNEGNMLFKSGQFGDALEKYTQAIDGCLEAGIDSPEDLCILYSNRAACFLKEGNSSDCIQDCTRSLELRPFSLKPLLRRAMAYETLERYSMAYVDYKTVLQIDTSVQAAHDSVHRITKLLIEQDGPNWREQLPEIPLVPLSAQQHHRDEPSAEVLQARTARAEQEKARKAEVRFNVLKQEGNDMVKNNKFQDAVEKYSECLAIKPSECAIYTNRALCYLKLESFEEAKQDCDSALQIEPNNKKAFYRRALAHKGLKDYMSASTDLQEVLQLDPNVQEAEQELEMVTNLFRESLLANAQGTLSISKEDMNLKE
ncbi:sperm-associated antigen 1A-like isoform X1 [Xyrauchen texanus]|uniref:sperm-associated antigen 1A-like isoform X1 n=2 Tax=Xyrauchen texanus TaxID=154827 RepID=UPI002241F719|nr:sperm-associated antigen 1A-like isoform X1 [Xyrauchen texanus]